MRETEGETSDRKQAIIEAAVKQLIETGLSGFSARSVAAAGNLSKSAVHYYFSDMHELLDAAEAEIARRYFGRVKAAAGARMDPLDRFWHAVEAYYRPFNENAAMTSQWLEYWIDATRRGKGAYVEHIQGELAMVFALLLEPLQVDNPARRARALTSYFAGALMRQMTNPIAPSEIESAVSDLCGVAAPRTEKSGEILPARRASSGHRLTWRGDAPAILTPSVDGLVVSRNQGISTFLLGRPEKANALTDEMLAAFASALRAVEDDSLTRAVVLRGAGERVFVSGSDLRAIHSAGPSNYAQDLYSKSCCLQIAGLPMPTIAAINGDCIGGGIMLAAATDLRIAVSTARFGIPVGLLGVAFPVESVDRLVRLVGPGNTARLLYTGEMIDAAEALRIGLVEKVVEPPAFDAAIAKIVSAMDRMAMSSLQASKQAINATFSPGSVISAERSFREAWAGPEAAERIARAIASTER